MTDAEIIKANDILKKLDFFGGQRAGRELWSDKPKDVQDIDIENFSNNVKFLKDFIDRQKAEIERLKSEVAVACIEQTPTVDVVEVKHGEWTSYETEETYGDDGNIWYKCSVCGTDALGRCYEDEWYSYPIKSDYCPYCGAKMDGERNKSNV